MVADIYHIFPSVQLFDPFWGNYIYLQKIIIYIYISLYTHIILYTCLTSATSRCDSGGGGMVVLEELEHAKARGARRHFVGFSICRLIFGIEISIYIHYPLKTSGDSMIYPTSLGIYIYIYIIYSRHV